MRAYIECFLCQARTGTDDLSLSPDELARARGWARVTDPEGETILYVCEGCIAKAKARAARRGP